MRIAAAIAAGLLLWTATAQRLAASAHGLSARAWTDTSVIRIGEQATLFLECTAPAGASVQFPAFGDTVNAFEIVDRSPVDTAAVDPGTVTFRQRLRLTRFDTGYCVIQPVTFRAAAGGRVDSAQSEALLLTVTTLPVDTGAAFRDIKPPVEMPLTFAEVLPWLLAGLAVAVAAYFLYRWLKRRQRKPAAAAAPNLPAVPPHVTALESLQALAGERLWQQGLVKQYHTRLTDIVRTYIEGRFGVLAMEQTTDEVLRHLRRHLPAGEAGETLAALLMLADLVKFAKGKPDGSENEASMARARDFVLMTKPVTSADIEGKEAAP